MTPRSVLVYQLIVGDDEGPIKEFWYEHPSDAEVMQAHYRARDLHATLVPQTVELSKEGVCRALWEYPVRNLREVKIAQPSPTDNVSIPI